MGPDHVNVLFGHNPKSDSSTNGKVDRSRQEQGKTLTIKEDLPLRNRIKARYHSQEGGFACTAPLIFAHSKPD